MSDYIVQSGSLTAVANKIREKTGGSAPLEFPDDFITGIESIGQPPQTPNDSILFYSRDPFTLEIKNHSKNWGGTIEMSIDHSLWTEWDGTTILQSGELHGFYVIYLRGMSNTLISGDAGPSTNRGFQTIGSGIKCVGNLATLLNYQNPPDTASANAFKYVFYKCSSLDFDLTIPYPSSSSYVSAFSDCASLTKAPELPATVVPINAYQKMFMNCTNLTHAPALPATTLSNECYSQMFSGCSALKTPPELPATTLQTKCYERMFYNSGLTSAPELPATTLATNCYQSMFSYCFSLSQIPALPATTLAAYCYDDMFSHSGVTQLPELPTETLTNYCYRNMFVGCSGIKLSSTQTGDYQTEYRIPSTGTGTTATSALYNFCANTGGTFTSDPVINTTYYTSNTVIPAI